MAFYYYYFLIKYTFSSTNRFSHSMVPSCRVTSLIRLEEGFKTWPVVRGKKFLFYETVSVKTGLCPNHRNFKQSASSVGTDRFKYRVG